MSKIPHLIEQCMKGSTAKDIIQEIEDTIMVDVAAVSKEFSRDLARCKVDTVSLATESDTVIVMPSVDTTQEQAQMITSVIEVYERVYPEVYFVVARDERGNS